MHCTIPNSQILLTRLSITLGGWIFYMFMYSTLSVKAECVHVCFSEGKLLRDDEILQNLPVGTTATMYFRDLGPQLGWTMVRGTHIIRNSLLVSVFQLLVFSLIRVMLKRCFLLFLRCFWPSTWDLFSPTSSSTFEYRTFTHTNMPSPPALILLSRESTAAQMLNFNWTIYGPKYNFCSIH